jgi:hypothetical protein
LEKERVKSEEEDVELFMRVDAAVAVQVDYLLFCRLDGGKTEREKVSVFPIIPLRCLVCHP